MALESTTCGIVHHARRTRAHCPTMVSSFKLSSGTVCLLGFSCRAGHIRKGKYKICGSYQVQDCTGRNGKAITWTPECQIAFEKAKSALAQATLLHHPKPDAATSITVDASDVAIGAQLEQLQQGKWVPLAFYSRKLSSAEKNYSAFDRELLAAYSAILHFRHFVEAKPFTIYTDHKPLVFALTNTAERSPRQACHLSFIAEFTTDIQYIKGKHNKVADTLSRINAATLPLIDFRQLAADQLSSAEIEAYRTAISSLNSKT